MNTTNINPNQEISLSQTRAILAYMRAGNVITPDVARRKFGSDRLGARIKDIEKIVGYEPPRRMVKVLGKDANGNPKEKRVMSYWLNEEDTDS